MTTITDVIIAAPTDPASPAITFYDDASGERTELSTLTSANWAAKVANYLRDELGVVDDDWVTVDLPVHWQTAVVLLGCWWAGAHVRIVGSDTAATDDRIVFTTAQRIDMYGNAEEIIAVPLDPFAMPQRGLPVGINDFGDTVRVHGDQFRSSPGGGYAMSDLSVEAILRASQSSADHASITAASRVLSTRTWDSAADIIDGFIAPLVVGASVVLVSHPDTAALTRRGDVENVTATVV